MSTQIGQAEHSMSAVPISIVGDDNLTVHISNRLQCHAVLCCAPESRTCKSLQVEVSKEVFRLSRHFESGFCEKDTATRASRLKGMPGRGLCTLLTASSGMN